MNDLILLVPILVSLVTTFFLMPSWLKKAKKMGLVWEDMNKLNSPKVAGSGGLIAVLGFLIGVFIYIAHRVFYFGVTNNLIDIMVLITVVLSVSLIGLIDDLFGWRSGGLSVKSRIIFVLLSAIPLMAIQAGESTISLPLFGVLNLGLFYSFIIIPLGVVGATTTFNFLAGLNGLEAGQGILLLFAFGITAYFTGTTWLALIALCMIASLLSFLFYNQYPAKVFPGDVLTYAVGSLLAVMAILGNFEKIAIFFFIPYIIEVVLKAGRGKLNKFSFGKPTKSGELDLLYPKLYGLTHISIFLLKKMGIKSTERNAVYLIWLFQIIIIIIGFIIFRQGIFL